MQSVAPRLLVVDDEQVLLDLIQRHLARLGYDVAGAVSAGDALAIVSAAPRTFSLAIVDRTLPDLPGEQLMARLVQLEPDLPILACSGYPQDLAELRRLTGARRIAVLQKPFMARMLSDAVEALLASP